jgi:hypothetical protein
MRLIDLLSALKKELEAARASDGSEEQLEQHYHTLTARFDELNKYKLSDDVVVVGINIAEVKSDLKNVKNVFYSVHSGLLDDEINKGKYSRELGILAVKVGEAVDRISKEYLKTAMIKFTEKASPAVALQVEAATDSKKTFKALVDMSQELQEAKHDIEEAGKIQIGLNIEDPLHVKYLRETQSAPSTPEGFRALQDKDKISHDPKEAEKDQRVRLNNLNQDDRAYSVLENYQDGVRKLAATHCLPNMNWTIGRGPVWFMSKPALKEFQIKGLKVRFDPFFPGWIVADQYLLGIKPSLLKDKKELLHSLRHIREAFSQRFYTPFVYVTLPHVNLNNKEISKNKTKEETNQYGQLVINKKKQRSDPGLKEDISVEIPKFKPLPGSSLIWTWLMPENKYNALPFLKIQDFGFPVAQSMRKLDERMANSIIPSLKEDAAKRDALMREYSIKVDKEYYEQVKPLTAQIKEIEEKVTSMELTKTDLATRYVKLEEHLKELQQSLALAGIGSLREKLSLEIQAQEDKIAALNGQIEGHRAIIKSLGKESKSIKAQMAALQSRIRQEQMSAIKAIKEGKKPEDPK